MKTIFSAVFLVSAALELFGLDFAEGKQITFGQTEDRNCFLKADLMFLFDKSTSISKSSRFNQMKAFAFSLMNEFDESIKQDGLHIAFSSFRVKTTIVSTFNGNSYNRNSLDRVLGSMQYTNADKKYTKGGTTYTGKGIHTAYYDHLKLARNDATKILIVITDGESSTDRRYRVEDVAEGIRRDNPDNLIIPVGINLGRSGIEELKEIAGRGKPYYTVDDFDGLKDIVKDFSTTICKEVPIDCVAKEGSCTTCDAVCDYTENQDYEAQGQIVCTREQDTPAENNGKPCNLTSIVKPCKTNCLIPKPCITESTCGECDAKCNDVAQTQDYLAQGKITCTQSIKTRETNGGATCDLSDIEKPCEKQCTVVPCSVSQWTEWTQCVPNGKCGNGTQTRQRTITESGTQPNQCPPVLESQNCNAPCIPCSMSEWSEWSVCTLSNAADDCGNGKQARQRNILDQGDFPENCTGGEQIQECDLPCQPCVPGEWSEWSTCSVSNNTCGDGEQLRTREITPGSLSSVCPNSDQLSNCSVPCTTPVTQTNNDGNGVNTAAIAGGAAAGAVVLVGAAAGAAYLWNQASATKAPEVSYEDFNNPGDHNPLFQSNNVDYTNALNLDA